jgi:hypothetical protein
MGTYKILRESFGKSTWCQLGTSSPNSEGPMITPAIISPTTWGCPTERARNPTHRHTARMKNTWRKNAAEAELKSYAVSLLVLPCFWSVNPMAAIGIAQMGPVKTPMEESLAPSLIVRNESFRKHVPGDGTNKVHRHNCCRFQLIVECGVDRQDSIGFRVRNQY